MLSVALRAARLTSSERLASGAIFWRTLSRGPGSSHPRDNFGPVRVPADSYFCLGDNRDNSHDSRFWGMVPKSNLKGRACIIYWSFDQDTEEMTAEWQGLGAKLKQIGRTAVGFVSHTRWERTFRIVH